MLKRGFLEASLVWLFLEYKLLEAKISYDVGRALFPEWWKTLAASPEFQHPTKEGDPRAAIVGRCAAWYGDGGGVLPFEPGVSWRVATDATTLHSKSMERAFSSPR